MVRAEMETHGPDPSPLALDADADGPAAGDVFSVDPRLLTGDAPRPFDVFVARGDGFARAVRAGEPLTAAACQALRDAGDRVVHLRRADRPAYLRHAEGSILEVVLRERFPLADRARLLYDLAATVIGDVLERPNRHDEIGRAYRLAEHLTLFVRQSEKALATLVTMTRPETYLRTHSINVCVHGVALGHMMNVRGDDLIHLAAGCLLHDLGKRALPPRLLSKAETLSRDDWKLVRRHPELGVDMCRAAGNFLPERVLVPIAQHHERLDGSGYPEGLSRRDVHPFGRIAAVADVYDAMTSERPYARKVGSFLALRELKGLTPDRIDAEVFRRFILVLRGGP